MTSARQPCSRQHPSVLEDGTLGACLTGRLGLGRRSSLKAAVRGISIFTSLQQWWGNSSGIHRFFRQPPCFLSSLALPCLGPSRAGRSSSDRISFGSALTPKTDFEARRTTRRSDQAPIASGLGRRRATLVVQAPSHPLFFKDKGQLSREICARPNPP